MAFFKLNIAYSLKVESSFISIDQIVPRECCLSKSAGWHKLDQFTILIKKFFFKVFDEAVRAVLRPEPQKRHQRKCLIM